MFAGEGGAEKLREIFVRRAAGESKVSIGAAVGVSGSYVHYLLSGEMLGERTAALREEYRGRLPKRGKRVVVKVPEEVRSEY